MQQKQHKQETQKKKGNVIMLNRTIPKAIKNATKIQYYKPMKGFSYHL